MDPRKIPNIDWVPDIVCGYPRHRKTPEPESSPGVVIILFPSELLSKLISNFFHVLSEDLHIKKNNQRELKVAMAVMV